MLSQLCLTMMLSALVAHSRGWKLQRPAGALLGRVSTIQPSHVAARLLSTKLGSGRTDETGFKRKSVEDSGEWTTFKLSPADASELNKSLGVDETVLKSSDRKPQKMAKAKTKAFSKIKGLNVDNEKTKVKGFLQVNPAVCSGCGAQFQSKAPDSPGYLPKDVFKDHLRRSELMRATQEAVKVLEMAGLELDDPRSEQVLREGRVSEEVIQKVKDLAEQTRSAPEVAVVDDPYGPLDPSLEGPLLRQKKVVFNEATSTYEAHTPHLQEGLSLDELHMAPDALEAYLRRHERFDRKKKHQKKGQATDTASVVGTEGRALVDSGGDAEQRLQAQLAALVSPDQSTTAGSDTTNSKAVMNVLLEADLKRRQERDKVCVCQRCFRLQNYNQVDATLRPGWSNNELLTPERFEKLLKGIKDTPSVVLCLVDIFDLRGSILSNLKSIVGKNPLVIAANKVDLLPPDVSMLRLTNWIHQEVKEVCGFASPREGSLTGDGGAKIGAVHGRYQAPAFDDDALQRYLDQESAAIATGKKEDLPGYRRVLPGQQDPSALAVGEEKLSAKERKARRAEREANTLRLADVHLVSCQTGLGFDSLLKDLMAKAAVNGNKIHVMGAANVGKSSFINRLLETSSGKLKAPKTTAGTNRRARRAALAKTRQDALKSVARATVSNLPGTTLDFLKIQLPNGIVMVDTPGLLQVGQLTSKLNSEELRQVVPAKTIKPVTLRVEEQKCVLIGGLARVELLEGRPCFFTVFASREVKLHPTHVSRVDSFLQDHVGELIAPPASIERYHEIGPYVSQDIEITGTGWKKSDYDIVISGLGWVAVTGPGSFKVRVTTPKDTLVDLRPSLLPFEAPLTTVSFTGGRLKRKGAVKRVLHGRSGTLAHAQRNHRERAGVPKRKKKRDGPWQKKGAFGRGRAGNEATGRDAHRSRAGPRSGAPGKREGFGAGAGGRAGGEWRRSTSVDSSARVRSGTGTRAGVGVGRGGARMGRSRSSSSVR